MISKFFSYSTYVKEVHLDVYGHMNNAAYLTVLEEARWDLITKNGFGLQTISETGLGPTILAVTLKYLKELKARDEVDIQTRILSYQKKIGILEQSILRNNEICAHAEFTFGLFDLKERKLVLPTPEWLKAIGYLVPF